MLMDTTTEIISHVVGIFHTTLEEERMREVYDKFKALVAADPDNDPLGAQGVAFKAKYALEGFTPNLRYSDNSVSDPQDDIASPFYSDANYPIPKLLPIIAAPPDAMPSYLQMTENGRPLLTLEPPSSIAVITVQNAYLEDNDMVLLGSGEAIFTNPEEFTQTLKQLENIAKAIAAPASSEMISVTDNASQDAIDLHDKIGNAELTTLSGVSASMMHGGDAVGVIVNGVAVEEMPILNDLLPAFHTEDDETGEGENGTTGDEDDYETPDPFESLTPGYTDINPFEYDDGYTVVAGANTLVNEVLINTAWLDAPVISVMGDVVNLNIIAQVNVLVDHDIGTFGEFASSTAMNAASLTATVTTQLPDPDAEPEGDGALVLPSNWAVTRIDGDLIALNQVTQYNFVTDNDCAEITFDENSIYVGLGDNTVVNLTDLSELGFGYDLIMIGGSMISVNWINQVNVMFDSDTGTFVQDPSGGFSGSDNLLFNSAMINSVGVDSYGEMQDNFATASDNLANGGLTIDESVAHDSVFEGTEILRVLYIEGDFVTVNWIDQTNVLGDSDQVYLALENMENETGATATVTTGSNSTINVATINEFGVDSNVAVNGEVYDDALLYQADLIDTDADPLGVDMPALASEAVVFLADDMMSPDTGPNDATIIATAAESTATSDVMQTMLA